MEPDAILLQVPRQPFLGWLNSIASFKAAGIGDIVMTFHAGQLSLLSEWGQTGMTYEGAFNGTLRISGKSLAALASRHQQLAQLPMPLKLCLEPELGNLSLEAGGVKCVITQAPGAGAPGRPLPLQTSGGSVRFSLSATGLEKLLKQIFPRVPAKNAMLCLTAMNGKLRLRSGANEAEGPADTKGQGQVTLPAKTFRKVLDTYRGTPILELEASNAGLKLNAFKMPVSSWNASPSRLLEI